MALATHRLVFALLVSATALIAPGIAQEQTDRATHQQQITRMMRLWEADRQQADVCYELAALNASIGEPKTALDWLEKAVSLRDGLDPSGEPLFKAFRADPRFKSITEHAATSARTKAAARQEFLINDPELIPEGVAWDATSRRLFVGSLNKRKIVAVDSRGEVHDFIKPGQDGIWAVLGMKVDAKRNLLWAASAANERDGKQNGTAGVFAFDLSAGALKHKYIAGNENGPRLLNDLVIDGNGDVFVTDSKFGNVVVLRSGSDKLENLTPPGSMIYPNGIALARDGKHLYVAHFAHGGMSLVDKKTGAVAQLKRSDPKLMLEGVDGLYALGSDLVAVQNGMGIPRVALFRLNDAGDTVSAIDVLDYNDPAVEIPTTGALVDGRIYFIANSQIRQLDKGAIRKDHEPLQPVKILSVPVMPATGGPTAALSSESKALTIPFGRPIQVDGHASVGEWDDAAPLAIQLAPEWSVPVQIKHDGSSLLVAFSRLASPDGKSFRFPEVLIDAGGNQSATWDQDDWWFHASFRDCQSKGRPNDYSTCQKDAAQWEANNYETTQRAPDIIELRIPFRMLGIDPASTSRIGIAFDVTDTRSVWQFWPSAAAMDLPSSWAQASLQPMR